MRKLLEKYLANGFADFKGSTVSAKVVVSESCINEMVTELLRANGQPLARLVKRAAVHTSGPVVLEVDVQA
jgi:hypothetical protein